MQLKSAGTRVELLLQMVTGQFVFIICEVGSAGK